MRTACIWQERPGRWRVDIEEDRDCVLDRRGFHTHAQALAWAIEQVEEKEDPR